MASQIFHFVGAPGVLVRYVELSENCICEHNPWGEGEFDFVMVWIVNLFLFQTAVDKASVFL